MTTSSFPFTSGPYTITKAWERQQQLLRNGEYCSLRRDVADEIGRNVGDQIRLSPADDGRSAAFTVHECHDDDAEIRVAKAGRKRLGVAPGDAVSAMPTIPKTGSTRMSAFERNDVAETVWDDPGRDRLLVCAPHDGIESNTAQAGGIVRKRVGSDRASAWFCHAFGPDAFERFHISSTAMSPASYPGLASVAGRDFEYCLSFHVWSPDSGDDEAILVGGLADATLRKRVGERLRDAIDGVRPVEMDHSKMKYAGESEANLVNWLSADSRSGVQLELPPLIAHRYRKRVARATADFFEAVLADDSRE